jgi:fibronectin type 3 domain-containing protein
VQILGRAVKKNISSFAFFFAGLLFILFTGCEKSHLDPQLANLQLLPTPQNIRATIGNNLIVLSWEYCDADENIQYRVFRGDSATGAFALISTDTSLEFRDTALVNGHDYAYQVQAIDSRGYFSPRTTPITASPALFGLQIESGRPAVNHALVQVDLTAPVGTTEMCLANAEPSRSAPWLPFAASVQWYLAPGDGIKKVFAKFRDAAGNECEPAVSDSVLLDTQAQIFEFTLDAPRAVLAIGDTLHLALDAHETGGQATAQIGTWSLGLYDDGINSDSRARDGIYEITIVIPPETDIVRSPARGYFRDAAGNEAVSASSATSISIQSPPAAVQLLLAAPTDSQSIRLIWSPNVDPDFFCYQILAAKSPNIPDTAVLVSMITEPTQTNFSVTHLEAATTYYFKIWVVDQMGARAGSNELSAQVDSFKAPDPVFLSHPIEISPHSVTLQWTPANSASFLNYRIIRFDAEPFSGTGNIRTHILGVENTSWTDSGLEARHVYQYQVLVFNKTGQFSTSNPIRVQTPADVPPDAVVLAQPAIVDTHSVRLSWSQNNDPDFEAYFIFRSAQSPVNLAQPPNGIINNSQETWFVDSGLSASTTYYYKIVVVDCDNNRTASNEVVVTIRP